MIGIYKTHPHKIPHAYIKIRRRTASFAHSFFNQFPGGNNRYFTIEGMRELVCT